MKMIKKIVTLMLLMAVVAGGTAAVGETQVRETVKRDKVVRREWVDENEQPAAGPEGYASVSYTYEKASVTEMYYDTDNQPFRMPGGYYGKTSVYGTAKRLTDVYYLDERGKPAVNGSGYAHMHMVYNAYDLIKSLYYYNAADKLTVVPDLGYAIERNEYRKNILIRKSFFDEKKNAVDSAEGYAVMTCELNKKGQVTAVRYSHADGSPAECRDGWASCEIEQDKNGNPLCIRYFDVSGHLTDRGMEYAYEKKQYEKDTEYTVKRYGKDNLLLTYADGYTALRCKLNSKGQIVRESYEDETGSRMPNAGQVFATVYSYDAHDRLVQVLYEGQDGELMLNTAGYAGYRDTLDGEGFVIRRVFLGTDEKPVNIQEGYCEIRYYYNILKEPVKILRFDTDGVQID